MKKLTLTLGVLFAGALLVGGCAKLDTANGLEGKVIATPGPLVVREIPVVNADNKETTLDHLIVLVDTSDGLAANGRLRHEQELVDAFAAEMPNGSFDIQVGAFASNQRELDEYSGVPDETSGYYSLAGYDREGLERAANEKIGEGSAMTLARAMHLVSKEIKHNDGNYALLIFSDGLTFRERPILKACNEIRASHHGRFCIYAAQMGDTHRGTDLLEGMVAEAGCGEQYSGAVLSSAPAAMKELVRAVFFTT